MADDFCLLFDAVVFEGSSVFELIGIAAERVAHQRKIEAAAGLGLPDVRQLMDEKTLTMQWLATKVLRPEVGARMEMDIAHWRHSDAARLEGPPPAANHSNAWIVNRVAEDRSGKFDLASGERTRNVVAIHGFPIALLRVR